MKRFALACVVLALAVRALVPAGWMPSGDRAFALTVCTGVDIQTIWMDSKGGLHEQNPDDHQQPKHEPCAFAGTSDAASVAQADIDEPRPLSAAAAQLFRTQLIGIGHGLAAPPPPQTGPPILI